MRRERLSGNGPALWLELGDQLIFDGADYEVTQVIVARADRLSFQQVRVGPSLGGEPQRLLQVEGRLFAPESVEPGQVQGEEVSIGDRKLRLRWEAEVRTERADTEGEHRFGLGRCAYYEGEDGCVAVRVDEEPEGYAIIGTPLDPSRIDLRFTESARRR